MSDHSISHIDLPNENASRAVCKALVSGDIQQADQRQNLVDSLVDRFWPSFRKWETDLFQTLNEYLTFGPVNLKVLSA